MVSIMSNDNNNLEINKQILEALNKLKKMLLFSMLEDEVLDLKTEMVKNPNELKESSEDNTEFLDDNADKTTDDHNKEMFLLHRPMDMNEYQEEGNELTVSEGKEWWTDLNGAKKNWDGDHPLVSCWVPKDSIKVLVNDENNGTWGDLGENPNSDKQKVTVKAGTYKIQEVIKEKVL